MYICKKKKKKKMKGVLFYCRVGLLWPSDPNNMPIVNKLYKGGKKLTGVREAKCREQNIFWVDLITVLVLWVSEQHDTGDIPSGVCKQAPVSSWRQAGKLGERPLWRLDDSFHLQRAHWPWALLILLEAKFIHWEKNTVVLKLAGGSRGGDGKGEWHHLGVGHNWF